MNITLHNIYIAFRILKASLRGTEVAIYDYAVANEEVLGNKSIIVIANILDNEPEVIMKFSARFPVFFYDPNPQNSSLDIEKILDRYNCKILYTIAYGERRVNDATLSINKKYKTALHCVFSLADPHADTYIPISKYLAEKFHGTTSTNNNNLSYVPHIVNLPIPIENKEKNILRSTFRKSLHIPENAIVFGRHGGNETFNIYFVYLSIEDVLDQRDDIYFIFVNTHKFCEHPRIIYIDSIVDLSEKTAFILACDAMIHARLDGETFGIACGEFSICNKPVITCSTGYKAHIEIMGEKCILYNTQSELTNILLNFETIKQQKEEYIKSLTGEQNCGDSRDILCWNMYSEYSEEKVIKMWWKYLIEPLIEPSL